MAEQQLKVVYDGPTTDAKLDEALEKVLAEFGYERWASGYDLANDKRDLAFRRPDPDCDTEGSRI